ncbi:terminase small subunit [Cryobacterium psychrophilum]|uniref:Terminase small subunit actinomycetes phage-type domain-containing protein n=1 Tax=Cryobacterium psychrophilum TaxID=41988 RepID=A0A4Y8KRI9_9MICO|nr:hypothetical protein [Cryobacterium psychrophilum]TDW31012.1 hypothetical protein EDD25_2800 [Cryobacterium psychrophilum]TFD80869.1 hypothetical protein E3T53_04395 [Cryobacterium psychrophilum]
MSTVVEATEISVQAASHLDRTGKDAGAVAAILALARKIDDWDAVVDHIMEQIAMDPESKMRPPGVDNSSLPTYLKFCESLGLTPGSRGELSTTGKPAAPTKVKNDLADFKQRNGVG